MGRFESSRSFLRPRVCLHGLEAMCDWEQFVVLIAIRLRHPPTVLARWAHITTWRRCPLRHCNTDFKWSYVTHFCFV